MPVRTTSKDLRGFGNSKVLDSHSLGFLSTRRTGGGTNANKPALSYVNTNLLMYVDASVSSSYSGSGTTWFDLSGNSRNMILNNGPTYTSGTPSYFTFDGTDDYAGTSITTFNNTNNVSGTMEGWVNIPDITGYRHIFGMRSSDSFFFLLLFDTPNTEARVTVSGADMDINYNPGSNFWNNWKQIVFTFDRSDHKTRLYVNGSIVATSSGTNGNTFGTLADFQVGGHFFYSNMYGSKFLVYNKALNAAEVSQNYNAFKSQFGLT